MGVRRHRRRGPAPSTRPRIRAGCADAGHAGRGAAPGSRSGSAQAGLVAGDDQALDLAGAFVDLGDLGVAEIALDRHLLRVAHAAVDLQLSLIHI